MPPSPLEPTFPVCSTKFLKLYKASPEWHRECERRVNVSWSLNCAPCVKSTQCTLKFWFMRIFGEQITNVYGFCFQLDSWSVQAQTHKAFFRILWIHRGQILMVFKSLISVFFPLWPKLNQSLTASKTSFADESCLIPSKVSEHVCSWTLARLDTERIQCKNWRTQVCQDT